MFCNGIFQSDLMSLVLHIETIRISVAKLKKCKFTSDELYIMSEYDTNIVQFMFKLWFIRCQFMVQHLASLIETWDQSTITKLRMCWLNAHITCSPNKHS